MSAAVNPCNALTLASVPPGMSRTLPLVQPDGTFRNPWSTYEERFFSDVLKWKLFGDTAAPRFPSKVEAADLLPSATPDSSVLSRYATLRHRHQNKLSSSAQNSEKTGTLPRHPWFTDPLLAPDRQGRVSVTWCSHSAFVVQMGGFTILTDPVWATYASPVQCMGPKRMVPVPIPIHNLPHIDVVTISHNHYDHLDAAAVKHLIDIFNPIFVVPLGMKKWFSTFKRIALERVVELNWWEEVTVAMSTACGRCQVDVIETVHELATTPIDDPVTHEQPSERGHNALLRVSATPVQHWSMRAGYDRYHELWCGFVMRCSMLCDDSHNRVITRSVFHCGDTGYCPSFPEIGLNYSSLRSCSGKERDGDRTHAIDVALIPIGAYSPRDFMKPQHVDPAEAVQIHDDIRAKYSIGMHWGTFILTDEPIDEPPKLLRQVMEDRWAKRIMTSGSGRQDTSEFIVLKHGETKCYDAEQLDA